MPAPIPPLIRKQIEKAFLRSEGSLEELAKRFNVSVPTVRRITKGSKVARDAAEYVVGTAIADHVSGTIALSGVAINFDDFLSTAITDLANAGKSTDAKSKEGVLSVMLKALELYRKYNPLTMSELADLAIATPNFNPQEFAKLLREKSERLSS